MLSVAGGLDVSRDNTSACAYDTYRVGTLQYSLKGSGQSHSKERLRYIIDNNYSASPNLLTLRNIEKSMNQMWVNIVKWHVGTG